jgi:hypothetical protein
MAHVEFERPTAFAEGFLPSKYAQPLPWPVGVQEEYDVTWHVARDDDRPPSRAVTDDVAVEDLGPREDPSARAPVQHVAESRLQWRRHDR